MWLVNLFQAIKLNGGLKKSILALARVDDLKVLKYVGSDTNGNKYYENTFYFYPTDRWVIYSDRYGYDYDASQVSCAWFRWLHNTTDEKPTEQNRDTYNWMLPHEENMTGTENEYVPYSTCKPKIIPWKPEVIQPCKVSKIL